MCLDEYVSLKFKRKKRGDCECTEIFPMREDDENAERDLWGERPGRGGGASGRGGASRRRRGQQEEAGPRGQ